MKRKCFQIARTNNSIFFPVENKNKIIDSFFIKPLILRFFRRERSKELGREVHNDKSCIVCESLVVASQVYSLLLFLRCNVDISKISKDTLEFALVLTFETYSYRLHLDTSRDTSSTTHREFLFAIGLQLQLLDLLA